MNKIVDVTLFRPFCWMVMLCWCRFFSPLSVKHFQIFFFFLLFFLRFTLGTADGALRNNFNKHFLHLKISRFCDSKYISTRHTGTCRLHLHGSCVFAIIISKMYIWKFYILFTIDNEKRSFRATSTCEHVTYHRSWTSFFFAHF